jgi:GT2 family glycosyltransferase
MPVAPERLAPEPVDLTISIVSYNSRRVIEPCLASVLECATELRAEIVVVDNASQDGTVEAIRRGFPGVEVIENRTNQGFSRAHNRVLRRRRGRYVLVLNPDTIVLPGALRTMIDFMDAHPEAGMASCRTWLDLGRRFQCLERPVPGLSTAIMECTAFGRFFPNSRVARRYWDAAGGLWATDAPVEVASLPGGFIFVRNEVIAEVGELDEAFFLFYEEHDWYRRARAHGWKLYFVPQAEIVHLLAESQRSHDRRWIQAVATQSRDHYYRKHYGVAGLLVLRLLVLGNDLAAGASLWLRRAVGRRRTPRAAGPDPAAIGAEGDRLTWKECPNARRYLVEASDEPRFLTRVATFVTTAELRLPRDLLVRLPPDGVFWRVAPVQDDGQAGRFIRSGVIRRTPSGDLTEVREPSADVEPHRTARKRRP